MIINRMDIMKHKAIIVIGACVLGIAIFIGILYLIAILS